MDTVSGRMRKKLLEEKFSLENDLYWSLQSALFSGGKTEFWIWEQLFFWSVYEKKLLKV